MRKNLRNNIFLLLFLILPLALPACRENHQDHTAENGTTYTCPMHPQIVRTEPGSCPICGMDLVPQKTKETGSSPIASGDLNYQLKPTNQTVISGIKTIKPVSNVVEEELTLTGRITYDTRRQYTIPARFGGRIEKLYVQFNYQPVRKGQKLYEIYSPDLVTAQKELVFLLRNDAENTDLIRGAKQKLRYLGVTDAQINKIVRSGEASYSFTVYSPYSGYVVEPAVTTDPAINASQNNNASGGGMDAMSGGSGGTSSSGSTTAGTATMGASPAPGFSIREGMYINTGQTLFKVINADQVWAEFNTSSAEAATLQKGTPVTISFNQLPAQTITTKVHLVQPFYEAGESFAKVRALLPAPDKAALVGQLITGRIVKTTKAALWIPQAAVLDLGTTAVVFRKADGAFQPVNISIGQRTGDQVEVQSGLNVQTEIAANAQFLVDSESFIRVADKKDL